jgi:hypothetical protein
LKITDLDRRYQSETSWGRRDCQQIWSVAENILNKQSLTVDNGWSSSSGV